MVTPDSFRAERAPLLTEPDLTAELLRLKGLTQDWTNEAYTARTQVVFPLAGAHLVEGGAEPILVDATNVVLLPAGVTTRDRHPVRGDADCLIVTLGEDLVHELFPDRPTRAGLSGGDCSARPAQPGLQYAASLIARQNEASLGAACEGLEEATMALVRRACHTTGGPPLALGRRPQGLVRATKELLNAIEGPMSLTAIAREVGASPTYLTDLFRRAEGMPIYRYQMRLRLSRALRELPKIDSIIELALELGFSSHSHFTSAFSTAFGVTPSAYREAVRRRLVAAPARAA